MGLPALREAGRKDAAELLHRAIRAREVVLEGRRDREANQIREQAPTMGQQIELVQFAAGLWREFGNEDKAEAITELAGRMRSAMRRGGEERGRGEGRRETDRRPERPPTPGGFGRRGPPQRTEPLLERIEHLEKRLAELEQELQEARSRARPPKERRP